MIIKIGKLKISYNDDREIEFDDIINICFDRWQDVKNTVLEYDKQNETVKLLYDYFPQVLAKQIIQKLWRTKT